MELPATILLILAQVFLPKRFAFIPLLICVLQLGYTPIVGDFTAVRIILLVGIARAIATESLEFSLAEPLDRLALFFSAWALFSAFFHGESLHNPYTERIGLVLNIFGAHLYARSFFKGENLIKDLTTTLVFLSIPLAILLLSEQATGRNLYSILGARSDFANMRSGEFRAQGPFGHAIISGTMGALIFPLAVYLRKTRKLLGTIGLISSVAIAISSGSSGPLAALAAAVAFLCFWPFRRHLKQARYATFAMLFVLNFLMSRPVWFLIARIDLVGGSTGWHRAALIDSAIRDLGSWWWAGTDYTRDWMFSGVAWNPNHTDITNYYLQFGVTGGLPLMIAFIAMIVVALKRIEATMSLLRTSHPLLEFGLWALWISIFAQCVSFISIAYFDQSFAIFFSLLGMTPAVCAALAKKAEQQREPHATPVLAP